MLNLKNIHAYSFLGVLVSTALIVPCSYADLAIGDGVGLGDSVTEVEAKLQSSCKSLDLVSVESVRFPMSEALEQHLLCIGYQSDSVTFQRAAFTFADNSFSHMEAHGVSVSTVLEPLGRSFGQYLGYSVHQLGSHWLHEENEVLVWVNPEGRHLNLFAWRNPLLSQATENEDSFSSAIPELVDFNLALDQIFEDAEENCSPILIEPEDEIWLQNSPSEQTQINCFNYIYAGFSRKMELVFGDGKLEVVWILTAKGEEQRLRDWLIGNWGAADLINENWEVFNDGKISLRKDTPELLILSNDMIPIYLELFNESVN